MPQTFLDRSIDVAKLGIAIRVIRTLLGLAIALQAVVQVVQDLRDRHVTDRMVLLAQLLRNRPRALTDPSQGRLGVSARLRIDQFFEAGYETGVGLCEGLAARPRSPDAAYQRLTPSLDFADTLRDRLARQATGVVHERDAPITQAQRFIGRQEAACALVQMRPHRPKLPFQFWQGVHAYAGYGNGLEIDAFIYLQRLIGIGRGRQT